MELFICRMGGMLHMFIRWCVVGIDTLLPLVPCRWLFLFYDNSVFNSYCITLALYVWHSVFNSYCITLALSVWHSVFNSYCITLALYVWACTCYYFFFLGIIKFKAGKMCGVPWPTQISHWHIMDTKWHFCYSCTPEVHTWPLQGPAASSAAGILLQRQRTQVTQPDKGSGEARECQRSASHRPPEMWVVRDMNKLVNPSIQ